MSLHHFILARALHRAWRMAPPGEADAYFQAHLRLLWGLPADCPRSHVLDNLITRLNQGAVKAERFTHLPPAWEARFDELLTRYEKEWRAAKEKENENCKGKIVPE
jgi:hypothetical protein